MEKKKERIAKMMAHAGLCSRRDAERWIKEGRVVLNGVKLETPATLVDETDEIIVDGKKIQKEQPARLWCYYKPVGLLTTHRDPQNRPCVFDHLPAGMPRVVSVGRLDYNSEGLLLLTTDGDLARSMELPARGWKRKYRVRIHGHAGGDVIAKIAKGVTINGINYAPASVEIEEQQTKGSNQWLLVTLTEGKNREIRKLMAHFGFEVSRLIRVAYGPFQLGNMAENSVREVPAKVIKEQL